MSVTRPQHDSVWDAPIVTILVLILVTAGAVDIVLDGSLSKDWRGFVDTIAVPLAGLAVGRGWAARKAG